MRIHELKTRIVLFLFAIVIIFGASVLFLGATVIKNDVIARAQKQIKNDLRVARSVFDREIEIIQTAFALIPASADLEAVRQKVGLDYLYAVTPESRGKVKSEIVQRAFEGRAAGGIRVIGTDELKAMGQAIYDRCAVEIRPTPKARPSDKKKLEEAMAIGYAMPVIDDKGRVEKVFYGGKIINRDFVLVDKIRDLVYGDQTYGRKPLGTVTIFLHDIRIATNVLDDRGQRAVGTAVSETVCKKVLEQGQWWLDRAFVVTDWYLTAYEPLRNLNGETIGILYVGSLEKPFIDLERRILLSFLAIILVVAGLAMLLSYALAASISNPVRRLLVATRQVSEGDLGHRVSTTGDIPELTQLAVSFNEMASRLHEREESIKVSNERLMALNERYLDLIGFVAHELKGSLATTILNAYSVRDGFLGLVNFKQRKAMDSVTKNLDHLEATVRNFLDLSRIEKGQMKAEKKALRFREDVFEPAIESFAKSAGEKQMEIVNSLETDLALNGDAALLRIAANNLIGNAIKYGRPSGRIVIASRGSANGHLEIEVYNDGDPIDPPDREKLFKRFSRLNRSGSQKVQGTGLGLFITKEIIEKHNGRIWVESKEGGNAFIFNIERGLLS